MRTGPILNVFPARWPWLLSGLVALALAGCITLGKDFPQDAVDLIKPGTTTLEEVRKIFGNPIRTGTEDGKVVWTYLRYHANIVGDFDGKDLIVKFDDQNKVLGVSFNSTEVGRPLKR
jgi:outer membrane protein assembly factor BamE (lipoprotein component of BamABCDE complex)